MSFKKIQLSSELSSGQGKKDNTTYYAVLNVILQVVKRNSYFA